MTIRNYQFRKLPEMEKQIARFKPIQYAKSEIIGGTNKMTIVRFARLMLGLEVPSTEIKKIEEIYAKYNVTKEEAVEEYTIIEDYLSQKYGRKSH